jgi:hypothetical protein
MLKTALAPGSLHQDPPHRLGRRGKEVLAASPTLGLRIVGTDKPEERFMYKCSGLQRLARLLMRKPRGGELSQFFVDQRQQPLRSRGITMLNLRNGFRDFGHAQHPRINGRIAW